MSVRHHSHLIAWQKAMDLVTAIYKESSDWPSHERFGLTSQVRKSVVSVPSNIAEGHGRRSRNEFGRFLNIAHGSLMEVETQLRIAANLGYLSNSQLTMLLDSVEETGRTLYGLLSKFTTPP